VAQGESLDFGGDLSWILNIFQDSLPLADGAKSDFSVYLSKSLTDFDDFLEGRGVAQGLIDYILMAIRSPNNNVSTIRTRSSLVHEP